MVPVITVRHCDISDPLRDRALTVLDRLGGAAAPAVDCTVVFDRSADGHRVEVRLRAEHGDVLIATAAAGDTARHSTSPKRSSAGSSPAARVARVRLAIRLPA
ncbi:MAG: HPF/RaiA family ribosome-associated protein [Gemmatimonadales bacterium]|nr:HPF/RaiA family ribosome-associated protein [Gemmatimonadales bacterium]